MRKWKNWLKPKRHSGRLSAKDTDCRTKTRLLHWAAISRRFCIPNDCPMELKKRIIRTGIAKSSSDLMIRRRCFSVSFYHGGDVLYGLEGPQHLARAMPGIIERFGRMNVERGGVSA
jgi:hypothetical protein